LKQPNFTLTIALTALRELGIREIVLEYSGGGDSGGIDTVQAYKDSEMKEPVDMPPELQVAVEERANTLLDKLPDWYNNDGGYGTLTFDLETFTAKSEHTVRVVQEHNEGFEFEL
jgi:hypothetical protein